MWAGWVQHSWRFGYAEVLCEVGPKMPERGSKTSMVPVVWANFRIFFGVIQMISCCDWWPWTKLGYITMTRRQNNNQWSDGIVVHPAPKNSECKNPLEIARLEFLGPRQHPPHWLSSKGPNCQSGVFLISAGAIEGHFEGKTLREVHSCTTMPWLTRHLQPRRNWPTWTSTVLITHPILRI